MKLRTKTTFYFTIALFFLACRSLGDPKIEVIEDRFVGELLPDSLREFVAFNESEIALINATVIDGKGEQTLYDQTILIENGEITFIGEKDENRIPKGFKIVDISNKTIIPGIVGIHNHLHIPRFRFIGDVASKLYLASGVTTIQTCGSAAPDLEIELSKDIERLAAIGPDIITSGPYFTGVGGNPNMIIPRNEEHIRDTMQYWIEQGVSWFKVYRHTDPNDLAIIIDEAHKNNCKVSGHFCSITYAEATALGIDGVEHGLNSASDFRSN